MSERKPNRLVSVGLTNAAILAGEVDLSTWSMEELERGQKQDANGRWVGRKPKVIPRALYDEFIKRKMSAASELMRENSYEAVATLAEIMKDPNAENRDRITAAKIILDRVYGKEPIQLNVAVQPLKPWEVAMEQMVVGLQNAIESGVVDADSWEDDDEPAERNPFMIGPNSGAEQ